MEGRLPPHGAKNPHRLGYRGSTYGVLLRYHRQRENLCHEAAVRQAGEVCDGKGGGDFDFLKGCDRYAAIDVTAVFDEFYNGFLARQRGEDESRDMRVLVFDEWSAYLDGLDEKKQMEAQRKKLGQLLRLGRSFRYHVLLGQQRMDAAYFQGFRENFNLVIGLSNLSKESRDMFFSEFKDQMEPDRARGTGYMTVNGAGFTPVAVPKVNDLDKLHRAILAGVTR